MRSVSHQIERVLAGVCHADRGALLSEVARCAHAWEQLNLQAFTGGEEWPAKMHEAEAALMRASARLAQLPDCSD